MKYEPQNMKYEPKTAKSATKIMQNKPNFHKHQYRHNISYKTLTGIFRFPDAAKTNPIKPNFKPARLPAAAESRHKYIVAVFFILCTI